MRSSKALAKLGDDVRRIFPTLFAFYAYSAAISAYSEAWRELFFGPGIHVGVILLGGLSLLGSGRWEWGRAAFIRGFGFALAGASLLYASDTLELLILLFGVSVVVFRAPGTRTALIAALLALATLPFADFALYAFELCAIATLSLFIPRSFS
jgi:hypothetical protein